MVQHEPSAFDADKVGQDQVNSVRQFVSFVIGQEMFAFSIEKVQEIIRVPNLVRVPMSPVSMLGLANLRGEILPVFDLRGMLGKSGSAITDTSRVIVVEEGAKVGLVVDRVAEVLNVPADRIEDVTAIEKTVSTDLLMGVVKNFGDHGLIQLVDPSGLPELQRSQIDAEKQSVSAPAAAKMARPDDDTSIEDVLQIVSFQIGTEEYAFKLADVDEIVRVPTSIAEVPNAPRNVLGLITLRDRVLPMISLRDCLGVAPEEGADINRVVVLRVADENGEYRQFGMVVDRVREVLRVPMDQIDDVPEGVKRRGANEIECICKLDDGARIVSVLSAYESLGQIDLNEVPTDLQSQDTTQEAEMTSIDATDQEEVQLVVFKLANEDFGISIHSVQEIIRLPDHFVSVPNADHEIEGIINLRGMVLPVIDMRRYFNMSAATRTERQRIIVLSCGGTLTGYIVDSVTQVLRVTTAELTAPPPLNNEAAKFVQHVAKLRESQSMVLVLDSAAFDVVDGAALEMEATP
ncbi:hypothetical protein BVC71_03715 [Marivivens niveibacter]|uniref:Chemotaxis protein CheW n=1 Tax=Marivivens niveibacter TaxID=1930667 RepID=A0A251X1K8_9RHOB|nr:chemotaxis protein CheW [Marivivens niveibacter]OUD10609.1 hypothetical protein BVC71_03715 [Marivivens niveibacter]